MRRLRYEKSMISDSLWEMMTSPNTLRLSAWKDVKKMMFKNMSSDSTLSSKIANLKKTEIFDAM
ncbi:MAG: hypothetical protein EA001_10920 [Oscillatoriales cyanobacterium]|nr:MAG: hypothetical protein EA001_10920 [Oscillatoriales cyanobacterium]